MTGDDEQARSFGGFLQFVKYQHMCTLGILQFEWYVFLVTNKPQLASACWSFEASWWKGQIATTQVRQENLDSEAHPNDLTRWNIWLSGKSKRNDWVLPEDIFLKINSTPGRDILLCQTAQLLRCQLGSIWFDFHSSILSFVYLGNTSSVSFFIIIRSYRSYLRCADCERLQASERKDSK